MANSVSVAVTAVPAPDDDDAPEEAAGVFAVLALFLLLLQPAIPTAATVTATPTNVRLLWRMPIATLPGLDDRPVIYDTHQPVPRFKPGAFSPNGGGARFDVHQADSAAATVGHPVRLSDESFR